MQPMSSSYGATTGTAFDTAEDDTLRPQTVIAVGWHNEAVSKNSDVVGAMVGQTSAIKAYLRVTLIISSL